MTRRLAPAPRVVSVEMADGSDISSPEARALIGRALIGVPAPTPQQPAPKAG